MRYDPALPRSLDDVTVRIPPGGRVAVTGSSGAGKSTLVNTLLRFWPLEAGRLSVDGRDIARFRQSEVRQSCALADQRAQMFFGTVRSNVTLGRPDATEEEIGEALRAACLDRWVADAPRRTRHPRRRGRCRPVRRRASAARRRPRALGPREDPHSRRADQRARPVPGRGAAGRSPGRGGRPQRPRRHAPIVRGGTLRRRQ